MTMTITVWTHLTVAGREDGGLHVGKATLSKEVVRRASEARADARDGANRVRSGTKVGN